MNAQKHERTDAESQPAPDVSTDRLAPAKDGSVGGGAERVKKPPLEINEIENLEDDAKGG